VLPAFPCEHDRVVDPTGAGDSFAGGLMAHLAETGRTDMEAIQAGMAWGTVTASFTIESFSLHGLSNAGPGALKSRMDEFRRIAAVG